MIIRPTCIIMIIVAIIIMLLNSQHSPSCDVKIKVFKGNKDAFHLNWCFNIKLFLRMLIVNLLEIILKIYIFILQNFTFTCSFSVQ